MSKEPIGFRTGDVNSYGYAAGDPVNLLDPLGLYWTSTPDPVCMAKAQKGCLEGCASACDPELCYQMCMNVMKTECILQARKNECNKRALGAYETCLKMHGDSAYCQDQMSKFFIKCINIAGY